MRVVEEKTHGKLSVLNWSTLSDERAAGVRPEKEIRRAALILTGACDFACPYCKTLGGGRAPTIKRERALELLETFAAAGLRELRISGGEPVLVPWLPELIRRAVELGVRVAVSSNGYSEPKVYEGLIDAGVAEFSISLDSAEPEEADRLSGGRKNVLARVKRSIEAIASRGIPVYVGMTCGTGRSAEAMRSAVELAERLGVAEIKIMSLAQEGDAVDVSWVDEELAERFPLLRWRAGNYRDGRDVRGLREGDSGRCSIVLDDLTVAGDRHYPCNVYFREGGEPIGNAGDDVAAILSDRAAWSLGRDSRKDPICRANCMDILRAYNDRAAELADERAKNDEKTRP
jgi:molybdenum cofactor biosynthesis enzyme MoaA